MADRYLITGGSGFIGTNLIDHLSDQGEHLLNVDINPPYKEEHNKYWHRLDILGKKHLCEVFFNYKPTHVIHLAARTDMDGKKIDDYRTNFDGTINVLEAIKSTPSIERTIITSSQFVHQFKGKPEHDEDYAPHTVYGESKILTETYTRKADLSCIWTIIRPTNIWGPWHPRYPKEFWLVLKKGRYLHPGKQPVVRMYGYVGNVVHQIMKIFKSPPVKVNHKVFYVGDKPINLLDWVNGFSQKLVGKKVTTVPRILVKNIAVAGDILMLCGITFPITSSRYKSMTTDNEISMDETFELFGDPPYSLQDGINKTVKWLIEQNSQFWTSSLT